MSWRTAWGCSSGRSEGRSLASRMSKSRFDQAVCPVFQQTEKAHGSGAMIWISSPSITRACFAAFNASLNSSVVLQPLWARA